MSKFLEEIDKTIEPLVDRMDYFVTNLDPDTNSYYDADWGGIPAQVVFNKIFERVHEIRPRSHWITYLHTTRAVEHSKLNKAVDVCFLDYEPHEEAEEICEDARRVGIFGHHKERGDIRELCRRDPRFSYFNPRDLMVLISEIYERGLPILYPIVKVAENHDVDVSFIGALGFRGYGYKKLYEEFISDKEGFRERDFDKIIENVNLLTSHRLKNCSYVVDVLGKADNPNHEAVKQMNERCSRGKLAGKKAGTIVTSVLNSRIFGDVQVFPLKTDFQLIKTFVPHLDEVRASQRLKTTVCVQHVNNTAKRLRKVSIRTFRNIDLPELLGEAHEGQTYKNFGGHEKSGGFISSGRNTPHILKKFLNSYFKRTEQLTRVHRGELSFLK